jgi:hypothetical protein
MKKKKKKKKVFGSGGPGVQNPAQPCAGARAGASAPTQPRPTARNGAGTREMTPFPRGPRVRESGRGRRRQRLTGQGRTGRPQGKLGRRRVRRRFAAGDLVPGHRAGALA